MTNKIKFIYLILILLLIGAIATNFDVFKFKNKARISGVQRNNSFEQLTKIIKPPSKNPNVTEPTIKAKSVFLIDVETNKELYQENSRERLPIASTTKIMTALVVLEDYPEKINDIVTITPAMINIEGSDIQLRSGEKISVDNLLKGLLIMSGNDTAYALATYFGGKDDFIKKMNEKAQYLGLSNTFYQDPAGLNDEGYSTARDLAVIGAYAMRNSEFAKIVGTSETNILSNDARITHNLKSSNRLIVPTEQLYLPGAKGIKTGFTDAAGHCLVSLAQKDNHKILSVILNTQENSITASAKESRKLLDWGFNNWTW